MNIPTFFALIAFTSLLSACGGKEAMQVISCESEPGIERVCGLQNPEDLVHFAAKDEIIFSQFGGLGEGKPGKLSVLSIGDLTTRDLDISVSESFGQWGDGECSPMDFALISPHGLDLSKRSDGSWQLLVVNHGARESVEMFEVVNPQAGLQLIYQGCVIAPDDGFFNDLVALRGSDEFLVTQMMPNPKDLAGKLAYLKLVFAMDTGYIMRWTRGRGFEKVQGTDVSFANGISQSTDGLTVYLNDFFGGGIRIFEGEAFKELKLLPIPHADNSAWSTRGELLFAAHLTNLSEGLACNSSPGVNCIGDFKIVAYNPDTGELRDLLEHVEDKIPTATVALGVGDYLYLGTHSGDRITRVPYPE